MGKARKYHSLCLSGTERIITGKEVSPARGATNDRISILSNLSSLFAFSRYDRLAAGSANPLIPAKPTRPSKFLLTAVKPRKVNCTHG